MQAQGSSSAQPASTCGGRHLPLRSRVLEAHKESEGLALIRVVRLEVLHLACDLLARSEAEGCQGCIVEALRRCAGLGVVAPDLELVGADPDLPEVLLDEGERAGPDALPAHFMNCSFVTKPFLSGSIMCVTSIAFIFGTKIPRRSTVIRGTPTALQGAGGERNGPALHA